MTDRHPWPEIDPAAFDAIIDVRSPAEFAEDRLPGAINLPVLDNAERARVGTIYTRVSRFDARKIGAALVAANIARHLGGPALADRDGGFRPLVYCWRGGQRSGAMAAVLEQIGWRVTTLADGYRGYRRWVSGQLYEAPLPWRFVMLDGNTGTAKTEILHRITGMDGQVIDLEDLAAHRGSVFGDETDRPQPAQKGFESALLDALRGCDPGRPVFVEAESNRIGRLRLPPSLWSAMIAAPRLVLRVPVAERAAYLNRAYAHLAEDRAGVLAMLDRLRPLHGAERIAAWSEMVRAGDGLSLATCLIEEHYDPRYQRSRSRRDGPVETAIDVPSLDDAGLDAGARAVLDAATRLDGSAEDQRDTG